MFGLLSSSQIYGLQQAHEHISSNTPSISNNKSNTSKHRRSTSSLSDSAAKESKFFTTLTSMQGMKTPTNFIEKFIKSELLSGYDTIKNYKNFQYSSSHAASPANSAASSTSKQSSSHPEGILNTFNCLHGSYRSNCDGEFYEAVNVNSQTLARPAAKSTEDMTIKCSKNLLANPATPQAPATLQNYQKLPECEGDIETATVVVPSSGASSGEFNSDSTGNMSGNTPVSSLYKKLSFGGRGSKNSSDSTQAEVPSDNSSSSISTTTTNSSAANTTSSLSNKSNELQRTSSASSSGDCVTARERKKSLNVTSNTNKMFVDECKPTQSTNAKTLTPERAQRRKLIQMISSYEQQNKLLQRELVKEKRRRTEELACVVKSLLCFESKLKTDMKVVNQRLVERDVEICRLVCQNRALRKKLANVQEAARDEGVVEDGEADELEDSERDCSDKQLLEDCLVLEALQCINCKQQFYDIDLKEGWIQNVSKDGSRKNNDHTTEHGSSSDDTVSSSFYGARRSVRYTSKRTSGTFRDYMRSRSMNIDDPALDNNSEENTSTISRDDSQTSYEKINIYSRAIERMHGVKGESERESEQSCLEGTNNSTIRSASRISNKSTTSSGSKASSEKSTTQIEEDDGIFSPTQDDDFEEAESEEGRSIRIVVRRSMDFSEASPKQVYETSTDDWYASASDQEEIGATTAAKLYGHGAVNPVLECVNQILLQQSMEEAHERTNAPQSVAPGGSLKSKQQRAAVKSSPHQQQEQLQQPNGGLPRRSSLSGRRSSRSNSRASDGQPSRSGTLTRKRVHFSTKNSMVHVPRNDEHEDDEDDEDDGEISTLQQYHAMNYYPQAVQQQLATSALVEVTEHETLNYESIYSNEYEPIGSEHNSSNLYVDMESAAKLPTLGSVATATNTAASHDTKMPKLPPALPPKPANLLKFKKSLQQLDEMPDEHLHQECITTGDNVAAASEPDYCSISEVNMGMTSVQIVADVHKAPESEPDLESPLSELELEVSTVASDDTCAASQKTDEIEEIFADIPKLPNVAAIIAPKSSPKHLSQQQPRLPTAKLQTLPLQSDYLVMTPKAEASMQLKLQNARNLMPKRAQDLLNTPLKSAPQTSENTPLKLPLNLVGAQQYKRKHMPNILAEINKRMSQTPNSPTTPTKAAKPSLLAASPKHMRHSLENSAPNLPLQAEFDWYNLDAEYGSGTSSSMQQPDLLKVTDNHGASGMLAEIHEDHESIIATADEYNLDEEFSLACEKPDVLNNSDEGIGETAESGEPIQVEALKLDAGMDLNAAICEAVNFPLFNESSPLGPPTPQHNAKAKKMKKNLANFERFIEGSGMSTKPLPSKRKIYFAGPFV